MSVDLLDPFGDCLDTMDDANASEVGQMETDMASSAEHGIRDNANISIQLGEDEGTCVVCDKTFEDS